jgi:hypothetical protein
MVKYWTIPAADQRKNSAFFRCFSAVMHNRENAAQATDPAPENPRQNPT